MAQSPLDIAKQTGMSLQQVLQQIGRDTGWGDQYLDTGPIVDAQGMTWLGNGDGTYNVYQNDPSANNSPAAYNGRAYDKYNAAGEKIGSGTLSGYKNGGLMDYAPFAMLAAGMAPAVLGAGGAVGGAAGGMPASPTAIGTGLNDFGLGSITDANIVGSPLTAVGTQAPIPGIAGAPGTWADAMLPAAGSTPATSMGFDAALGGGAGGAAGSVMGAAGAGGASVAPGAAGAAGTSLLGSAKQIVDAIPGGLGTLGLLGGALAGAQGVKQTQNTSQHTDPRVDPYIFGTDATTNPGLLNMTQQQLMSALSPATLAGWDSIKSKGMGLMNQPVAGNGFNLLTKGRYQ